MHMEEVGVSVLREHTVKLYHKPIPGSRLVSLNLSLFSSIKKKVFIFFSILLNVIE